MSTATAKAQRLKLLVIHHRRIDLLAPRVHPAFEVQQIVEPMTAQKFNRARTPNSALTDHYCRPFTRYFVEIGGDFPQWKQARIWKTSDFKFERFTDVDQRDVFIFLKPLVQLDRRKRRDFRLRPHAAKLLIVNRFSDARVLAADGTILVPPDLELTKPQRERINVEQTTNQTVSDPQDELDCFHSLHHAD